MIKALSSQNIESIIFNYRYDVIWPNDQKCDEKRYEQKIPVVNREEVFHGGRKSVTVYSSLMEMLATLKFLLIEKNLESKSDRYVVNVVNCFKYPRFFAKCFLKAPIVPHFYSRKAIRGELAKIIIDKADKIITSSKTVANYLEETYNVNKKKMEILYPPMNVNFYRPSDKNQARRMLRQSEEDEIILYIGNLRRNRFPEEIVLQTLYNLAKEDTKIKLLIFTPRNDENIKRALEIKTKAKKLNLMANIRIKVENLSEKKKHIVYVASDLFLYPSLDPTGAIEPPLTILEAMASGLPVISNDLPSAREIIHDGINGYLVSIRDEQDTGLAEKISELIGNSEIITKLSYNARKCIVEEMSYSNSCIKLINVYKDAFRT